MMPPISRFVRSGRLPRLLDGNSFSALSVSLTSPLATDAASHSSFGIKSGFLAIVSGWPLSSDFITELISSDWTAGFVGTTGLFVKGLTGKAGFF